MIEHTALVVGGTSGIGLATARLLQQRGATVHVVGRTERKLDPELIPHWADGGDPAQIAAVVAKAGPIDWLVVSLSGGEGAGPIAGLDVATLRRAFDAKFWAHLTTVRAALPHLTPTGSITLIGAISARAAMPGTAGLAAINGAVEALVKPLAAELAPIRVNGVSPGLVDTPWWSGFPAEARAAYFAQMAERLPTRRVATAEDVAEVVALAATNPNLTATVIEADGGARLAALV
ncbi:SDR family oxidoreductase [Actinoplanes sp. NPDC051513]|uniref:SDR family oxidoreductase n=1 Tax=Actinoplanes sp. NPDC051513 TaxID=3363908 RepID=UPI0037A1F310